MKDTAKIGRDSGISRPLAALINCLRIIGFVQLLFLAGATQHPIQQHHAQPHEFYQLLAPPCTCANTFLPVVNLMWVNFSGQLRAPNHIIPLIASSGELLLSIFFFLF